MQVEVRRNGYFNPDNFVILPVGAIQANISSTAFRLLCAYFMFANNRRQSWPSRNLLASMISRTADTVDRANDELIDAGLIRIESQVRDNGSQTVNLVTIIDPEPVEFAETEDDGGRKNTATPAVKIRPPELNTSELNSNSIDTDVSILKTPKKRGRKPLTRRTEGIDKLFIAFRSVRFPRANSENYNPAELKANQTVLVGVYEGGVTPEQFALATRNALERWDNPAMVSVRSVARNLSSLLEERQPNRKSLSQADQRVEDARRLSEERLLRQLRPQPNWDEQPDWDQIYDQTALPEGNVRCLDGESD